MRVIVVAVALVACSGDASMPLIDSGPCVDVSHDEDGDGVGDACDICPASPDPQQRDTTEIATMLHFADGVGDACDPRPSLEGDKLGAFHAFANPATASGWNGTGWTIDADLARASGPARWTHRTREMGDGVFVQARIARVDWQLGASVEITVDGNGVETGYACAIFKDRDGDGNDELEVREALGTPSIKNTSLAVDGASSVILTVWRTIALDRSGQIRCRVKLDATTTELTQATSDDLAVGLYGFAASSTTDVSSIVVYTSPTLPQQDL